MGDMSEITFGEKTPEEQRNILYDKLVYMERRLDNMERVLANINKNMVIGFTSMTAPSFEQMVKVQETETKKQLGEYKQQIYDMYSSPGTGFYPEYPSAYDRILVINNHMYDGRIMVDRLTGNYAMKYSPEDKDAFLKGANKYLSEHSNLFVTLMDWPLKVYSVPGVEPGNLFKIFVKEKEEKE